MESEFGWSRVDPQLLFLFLPSTANQIGVKLVLSFWALAPFGTEMKTPPGQSVWSLNLSKKYRLMLFFIEVGQSQISPKPLPRSWKRFAPKFPFGSSFYSSNVHLSAANLRGCNYPNPRPIDQHWTTPPPNGQRPLTPANLERLVRSSWAGGRPVSRPICCAHICTRLYVYIFEVVQRARAESSRQKP